MKIIGFSFTKMSGERLKESADTIKVNTELDFPDIREAKSNIINSKDELLEATFEYKVNYEPNLAKIVIGGKILVAVEKEEAKEVLSGWKKKTLPEKFRTPLFNVVIKKSTLKALNLSDELNLPVHIPFPSLKSPQETSD